MKLSLPIRPIMRTKCRLRYLKDGAGADWTIWHFIRKDHLAAALPNQCLFQILLMRIKSMNKRMQ